MKSNKTSELRTTLTNTKEKQIGADSQNSNKTSDLRPQNSERETDGNRNGKAETSLRAKRSKFSERSGLSSGAKSEAVSALSSFPKIQRKVTSEMFHGHIYVRGPQNA